MSTKLGAYLSVDPGESNGIAWYDEDAKLQGLFVVKYEDLEEFLAKFTDTETVLCEQYRVYEHKAKAHTGSLVTTARAIGKVTTWAKSRNARLIFQDANKKAIGFKYLGEKEPKRSNSLSHAIVAHAHFTYWAVRNKLVDPKELIRD